MRKAISRALDLARNGAQYMVLELPTGYGKTVAGPHLYRAYREAGLCWRAIHVFPLRAILHRTLSRYVQEHLDIEFTYQDGDVTLRERYVKDPYFRGEYVLTTLDSFVHNLLRVPVAEMHKFLERHLRAVHYHIPFAYIYPSCVFIDEAHIAAQDEAGKALAALKASLEVLRGAEVPVVVMSATLGEWKRKFFRDFTFIELGDRYEEEEGRVEVHDDEFERMFSQVKYTVEAIDEVEVEKSARKEMEKERRVLVIINNIQKAVDLAKSLGAVLIHSMLTREDRQKAESMLDRARVVVGTSAIEAGVDVSFDVLITSADVAESVVQRVGRVCRYGGACEGKIYLFGKNAETYASVKEWRLPYKEGSYVGLLRRDVEYEHGLYWLLKQMSGFIHVPPEELRKAYLRHGASFVRSALIEVCRDAPPSPERCFTAALDRAADLPISAAVAGSCRLEPPPRCENVGKCVEWLVDAVERCGDAPKLTLERYTPGYGPF
ncbi:MAG: CRISPR-associated helicase Cas3' [Pyrobaculum sp.]